jgi:hypothetical protein
VIGHQQKLSFRPERSEVEEPRGVTFGFHHGIPRLRSE